MVAQSLSFELRAETSPEWTECIKGQFDSFLLDHASAERKASAMAVSFVVQYPDRFELHMPMVRIAREELLHYQQVLKIIHSRNLIWERDEKDPYIGQLSQKMRTDREGRLLDRLLIGAVVEQRGVERFMLASQCVTGHLARFYERLSHSEKGHASTFLKCAEVYFEAEEIEARLDDWLDIEAEILVKLPIRPALH